ncbi:MAG: U32 family peptidase [Bacilli bacterium]|nr:U32 family peptidase [Bacilli bacterium]
MKRVELLSPAGNLEMLKQAVHNGADAVYLSGNRYGARKFAENFSNEEIIEAINYAHLYGVKVYITINTLIHDKEVDEFINYVRFIHKNNVDAVIMQDLGMINLVRKTFPNLEIHASTQFNNSNNETLNLLNKIGVKRAVLSRELSIDEIRNFESNIEKEVFIHGALCISYSGECLMSSMILDRSGNRGECAGLCRLPYKLAENDKVIDTNGNYLLSTKELCTINNMKEIIESNIDSLKIEGRMKSPEYVGYVTKLYRKAIDFYYNNIEYKISEKELNNLKLLYNREFTTGFLLNDKSIINQHTPNHIGIEIGKVIEINKDKIKIKLSNNLTQNDAIKFKNNDKGMYINYLYNEKLKLINKANKDEIIYIDNKINLKEKDIVLKTIDDNLTKIIRNYQEKKIPVNINVIAKLNKFLEISISDGINKVIKKGNLVEISKTYPITKEDIIEKISKLGNTIYKLENIVIDMDENIFIPIKEINEIRRFLVEELNKLRIEKHNNFLELKPVFEINKNNYTNELSILLEDENDYLELKDKKNITFYTENYILYTKYKNNNNIYYRLPRIIKNETDYNDELLYISDKGMINKYKDNNKVNVDIYSNVTNIYTLKFLLDNNIKKVGISPELTLDECYDLYKNYIDTFKTTPNIEILIYGKIELMLLKHCILKENINNNKLCNVCENNNRFSLIDRNNEVFSIIPTKCGNKILHNKEINRIKEIKEYKGVNYLISLIDIKNKRNIINEVKDRELW